MSGYSNELDQSLSKNAKISQSEWDKLDAALVVTRTHIYHLIKDENIVKPNCKYYCRVFASQVRIGINLNQNSFSSSGILPALISTVTSVIKGTSEQVYPTLVRGRVQIAAKFGTEWSGMTIRKE